MSLANWAHLAAVVVVLGWWVTGIIRIAEWVDLQRDQARARQHRMPPALWVKVHSVAAVARLWEPPRNRKKGKIYAADIVRTLTFATALAPALLAYRYPVGTMLAAAAVLAFEYVRQLAAEPTEIAQLRTVLAQIMGTDQKGRPPKVRRDGKHPSGGPLRLTISGMPGFQHWTKTKKEQVEAALEATMPGDWEPVDWLGDGTSLWERLPDLPDFAPYVRHLDLPWTQIPVGPDGTTNPDGTPRIAVMDLLKYPHWFIAGITRKGKTGLLRVAAAHLLHHGIDLVVLDPKFGLAYLQGRPGVLRCAVRRYERLLAESEWLLAEINARYEQLERDGSYRDPLAVLVDELAVACDLDRALGTKAKGAKYGPLVTNLINAIRLAGQVDVHMLLATQRPAADVIPVELRGQAEGRAAVGPMEKDVAMMLFESGWVRATATADVKGRLVLGSISGEDNCWAQAFWSADPGDPRHDEADRTLAESLLPAPVPQQGMGSSDDQSGDHSESTPRPVPLPKWAPDPAASSADSPATDGRAASRAAMTAEERERDRKDQHAARQRKRVARLRDEMRRDPLHWKHGTAEGHKICPTRCDWCRTMRRPKLEVVES